MFNIYEIMRTKTCLTVQNCCHKWFTITQVLYYTLLLTYFDMLLKPINNYSYGNQSDEVHFPFLSHHQHIIQFLIANQFMYIQFVCLPNKRGGARKLGSPPFDFLTLRRQDETGREKCASPTLLLLYSE